MGTDKKWYAVYTKSRCEKKVAEVLMRKRVEVFCPLNKIVRQWADRKKVVSEPLFTSYVFVNVNELEHATIRQVEGVVNFVYWLGNPAVIRGEEIEAIRNFLYDYYDVKLEKINVNVFDKVRITDGFLRNREGDVLEVKTKTVKLSLPCLGYNITADVSKSRIEVINQKDLYTAPHYSRVNTG